MSNEISSKSPIEIFKSEQGAEIIVTLDNDTVWLNRQQLAELFDRDVKTIGKHIKYPSLEEKAATLLYLIVKNHSFVDGNKRIAAACFLYFLQQNQLLFNLEKSVERGFIAQDIGFTGL
ncbi:MAG: virulence protein RhuM/Fic/DOC family protein [Methylococcales bacterium]